MKNKKIFSWNFYSLLVIVAYSILQVCRWNSFPQFIDIYYHLLTAWGFIKTGGYTTWDFWQFAPLGRPHVYPPLFHVILALFMKTGVDKILLAKIFSVMTPVAFIFVLWNFVKKAFSARLAFLVLIMIGSSFSFYASLESHIPSTISAIFAMLAIGQFFSKKILRAALLFALCFYTHIGTSWFFASGFFIYILLRPEDRRPGILVLMAAIVLSGPVLIQQLLNLDLISLATFNEKYFCEFKTIDYLLAAFGFILTLRLKKKYLFFPALFIASFIYIKYPSRLFSFEGYLPVAILSAISLDYTFINFKKKPLLRYITVFLILFAFIFSPTLVMGKIYIFDSTFMNMLFIRNNNRTISQSIWFEDSYLSASKIIKRNSSPDDIIYCTEDAMGLALAIRSERATANYLLPEICSSKVQDPFADSKIIVMLKYHSAEWAKEKVDRYRLVKIGENAIFNIYKNPFAAAKIKITNPLIRF